MARINGFIGRRGLLRLAGIGGAGIAATAVSTIVGSSQPAQASDPLPVGQQSPPPVSPDDALKRLLDGNKRFAQQKPIYPDRSKERLLLVAKGQHPFAAMLSCADSRVPSEVIFDQGLGDLFITRVAGNVLNAEVIGSLEFATAVLGAQLIMVLGHQRCGAVAAAVEGEPLPGRIGTFVEAIKPAVARVKGKSGDPVDNAVIANVQYQAEMLKQSSAILSQLIEEKKLKIVGARYSLDTGEVQLV